MNTQNIVLDHTRGIQLDPSNPPFDNYQAFHHNYVGLKILADSVREIECNVALNPLRPSFAIDSSVPPLVPCAFNWFSVTLVNYLRLVALVDLMTENKWKSSELKKPENKSLIKSHCTDYVRDAIPEIYLWRNKVAAHFAATDPFNDDSLGTLEQSIMNSVSYSLPYFYVGQFKLHSESNLPTWALTQTHENLRERFWPDMHLRPILDLAC